MRTALIASLLVVQAAAAAAVRPPCAPCAGLSVEDPAAAAALLGEAPALAEQAVVYIRWQADLTAAAAAPAAAVRAAGAIPWLAVDFTTPGPLLANAARLEEELRGLAALAGAAGRDAHFELGWSGRGTGWNAEDYAYLIKRAAVTITGAAPDAAMFTAPLAADGAFLRDLYEQEVAAYLDGVTLAPLTGDALQAVSYVVLELDPAASIALSTLPAAERPLTALPRAADAATHGATIVHFDTPRLDAETVAPFKLLASEFSGDLAPDPYSVPRGATRAWSFVRGSDLALRVIVESPEEAERVRLEFPDSQLENPVRFDPASGASEALYGLRSGSGYELEVEQPGPVVLLGLDRVSSAEIEGMLGVEEAVTVADIRQIPVGEILRRLQAFEDAQARRLRHYQALSTLHLRFQAGTGAGSVEATFEGPYFFRQGEGFDWAWKDFYFNGVKWRHKSIPEIPLIQPEKAAAQPVEISFTREYRYSLRGTATVEGRDCWVVDFEPVAKPEPGRTLFQGTVWIDRAVYARVRTRAVQLGLEGDVLSNEETVTFSPLDADGQSAAWEATSFVLPMRSVGQQLWSVLNATLVVERESLLAGVVINGDDFDNRRQAALESESTMVRDTEAGLRYLVVDEETGERVVQTELDVNRRFLLGGVLYDEANDFPLPLAGMNWLWFDLKGTGTQANVFFGGVLATVAITDPDFLGSKFDAGIDAFALAVAGTDTQFRDGREINAEDVETLSPSVDFKLGRPIGNFFKLEGEYELEYVKYSRGDDTSADFVLPSDHLSHNFSLFGRYNRSGYRLRLGGTYHLRDEWEPWGFAGNPDYDPGKDTYTKWSAGIGKTWHFPNFLKFGAEIEYFDGSDLDRFSKYEFGLFSDVTVHGYQSDKVRAEEALATHLRYGFDVASLFRLDLVADAAWVSDLESGFDNELLGGVGVTGTVVGPWRTLINIDVGAAVTGPDSGFTAFIVFLKLFE